MIFAPIMMARQKEYIQLFRENNAFDSVHAVYLWQIGITNNAIVRRMVRENIIAKTSDDKYYLVMR